MLPLFFTELSFREGAEGDEPAAHVGAFKGAPAPPAAGADEAPPVIVLHGLLGSSRNFLGWASQLAASLSTPRRFLLVDLRNHGDSPHVERMDYAAMASDVARLMQHQRIDKAAVIGHSMGGKVAETEIDREEA